MLLFLEELQEVVKNSEILGAVSPDHSALLCSFQYFNKLKKDSGQWKSNNSLASNEDFIPENMHRKHSRSEITITFTNSISWLHLPLSFQKVFYKIKEQSTIKNRLKILKSNLNSNEMFEGFHKCKNKIYDNIAEVVKIRSKISRYEEGEKS